ncbi:MAG TPA: Xaa-Pro peptidase family protein [Bauldia sp.]|nr:Xaa-Pro peptidase family protein [Bauldia sp.]
MAIAAEIQNRSFDPWAVIGRAEFAERQVRFRQAMLAAGFRAALVASRGGGAPDMSADVLWLANHYVPGPYVGDEAGLGRARQHAFLVFGEARTIAVADVESLRTDLLVADRLDLNVDVPAAVGAALREQGTGSGRVLLVGASYMTAAAYLSLRRELPQVEFVVDDGFVKRLRMLKSPAELALLRAASQLGDRAIEAVVDAVVEGATEADAVALGAAEIYRGGGAPYDIVCGSGSDAHLYTRHRLPSADSVRRFVKGDLFHVDVYGSLGGYFFDLARSRCVGDTPDKQQRQLLETPIAIVEAICAAVRPGAVAEDLAEIGRSTEVEVSPFDSRLSERASFPAYGHGLGVSWEGPYIAPGDKSQLQAGMCLAIECRIGREGHGGAMFEQVGAVTENGFDQFTHARARWW